MSATTAWQPRVSQWSAAFGSAWLALQGGNPPAPPAGDTVFDLKLIGGQISTLVDYVLDPMTVDLMKRARNYALPSTPGYDPDEVLNIQSMVRSGNVVTVTLAGPPSQLLSTGLLFSNTCYPDTTFSCDKVAITVTDQTHFTYANTGSNATANINNINDVPAVVFHQVALNTAGHPKADFVAVLSNTFGSQSTNPDLNGTYNGTFTGGLPTNITTSSGTLTYVPGASTFTLVLSGGATGGCYLTFTGVPTDNSFRLPRLMLAGQDQSGATVLRTDYAAVQSRYGTMRFMDAGRINANASMMGWDKRSLTTYGLGMSLEDMIDCCNQLGCDMWYVFSTTATADYVTQACTLIRDRLNNTLKVYLEWGNELWNSAFKQWHWQFAKMRAATQALLNGYDGITQITSMARVSNTVTFNLSGTNPYTVAQHIAVKMSSNQDFNTDDVAVSAVTSNSFSFVLAGADVSFGSPGNGAVFGNLSSVLFTGNPSDKWDPYALFYRQIAEDTYQMSQLASAVFSGLNGRCRVVLPWQAVNFNGEYGAVRAYILPWLTAVHGAVSGYLYATGGAPYCYASAGNTTPAQTATSVMASVDDQKFNFHDASYVAHLYGLKHVQYEGGSDYSPLTTTDRVDAACSSDEMRVAHEYILNQCLGFGVDLHMCYTSSLRWPGASGGLSWGMASNIADAGTTIGTASGTGQRQKATDNVLLAERPPITDPNQIPGTVAPLTTLANFWDDQGSTTSVNGMRTLYNTNSVLEELVYVTAAGTYNMTIYGKCDVGPWGGINGVRIFVDDVLAGVHDLFTDGTAINTGTSGGYASPTAFQLTLTEGKHRIKFKMKDPAQSPDGLAMSRFVTVLA